MSEMLIEPDTEVTGYNQENLERAFSHYTAIKERLLVDHLNQYATVDVQTGAYAVGSSRTLAREYFRSAHGERTAYTFHIGTT